MNNTKTLILKERIRAAWLAVWFLLIIANLFVYTNNSASLSVSDGSDFKDWIVKFFSPHNWLMLATVLLTVNGLRSIWIMCEQKWPIIKDFRFVPIVAVIGAVLIFIGATF